MSKHQPEVYKKKLLIALENNLGIVTPSCKEVGISRDRFYEYYNTDEEFKKSVDEVNNFTLDFVENQLFRKIQEGSEKSILFFMKYKGRKRGYTDRLEIEGSFDIKGITTIELIEYKKNEGDDKTEKE